MKFLVFSDSHNYTNGIDAAIEKHKDIRHIIHCGDMTADIEYLDHVYGNTHAICGVCGNNDFFTNDPYFRVIPVGNMNLYVTHGHKERVKSSLLLLEKEAITKNCTVAIFGHTHTQFLETKNGITLLNPGSIGYFRQEYAIINIEKNDVNIDLMRL